MVEGANDVAAAIEAHLFGDLVARDQEKIVHEPGLARVSEALAKHAPDFTLSLGVQWRL